MEPMPKKDEPVVLDGAPTTMSYIREQMQRKDIRIVEKSSHVYVTLKRMNG